MPPYRIALAQTCFAPSSWEDAIRRIDRTAAEARAGGANLLMLPEMFTCGYGDPGSARTLAISPGDSKWSNLQSVARRHGIATLIGYSELAGGRLHNSGALISDSGELHLNYRKMHLWGDFEHSLFHAGDRSAVVELAPGIFAGVLICYDIEFAVAAQDLARRGANLILTPSATWEEYNVVALNVVPARAYENSVFVAFCNHVGRICDIEFAGLSTVAAPDGSIIERAPHNREALAFADIDPAAYADYIAAHRQVHDQRADLFPLPSVERPPT